LTTIQEKDSVFYLLGIRIITKIEFNKQKTFDYMTFNKVKKILICSNYNKFCRYRTKKWGVIIIT